jgi:hypothetical protein
MKKAALFLLAAALSLPASAETWKHVSLMDAGCAGHKEKLAKPDNHARSCALKCADSGYGVVLKGKFVKFDEKGSELTKAALDKSEKTDHLRVTVDGELKDGVIQVASLTLDK